MYPRNAATPPKIAIGPVVQISDGAVQTSGVSVAVSPEGGTESAGGGTITYGGSSGVVYYAPTQAETNYTAFAVVAYKTGCIPASVTVVTTASATAGQVVPADDSITAAKFDESTAFPLASADSGATAVARVGADGDTLETISDQLDAVKTDTAAILVDTGTDGVVVASGSKTGYALTADYDAAKTSAQAGDAMTLTGDYDAAKTSAQAGDAMTLTGDYDAAKTSAQAGDLAVVDANVDELVAMTEDTTAGRKFTEKALEDAPTTAAADVATAILVTPANKLATDVSGRVTVGSNADKSGYALTVTPPTAADIKTAMEAAGSHLNELLDMTEDATGGRRFTEKALEEAPSSSGGDATAANQTLILTALDDVKGTGFVKNTDSLVNLSANTPVQLTIESEVST